MDHVLPLTAREYDPNLCGLRKAIVLDRTVQRTPVIVTDGLGAQVTLFVRHADLYVTGLACGSGTYHFADEKPVQGSRALEFTGNYTDLGLYLGPVRLDLQTLGHAVRRLARHTAGSAGSNFFADEKRCLIRLIFVVAEAMRFWTIHNAVAAVIANPGTSLVVNDYAGHDRPLNSWDRWSRQSDWPEHGVFTPSLRR